MKEKLEALEAALKKRLEAINNLLELDDKYFSELLSEVKTTVAPVNDNGKMIGYKALSQPPLPGNTGLGGKALKIKKKRGPKPGKRQKKVELPPMPSPTVSLSAEDKAKEFNISFKDYSFILFSTKALNWFPIDITKFKPPQFQFMAGDIIQIWDIAKKEKVSFAKNIFFKINATAILDASTIPTSHLRVSPCEDPLGGKTPPHTT